jgi:hypothetical protein
MPASDFWRRLIVMPSEAAWNNQAERRDSVVKSSMTQRALGKAAEISDMGDREAARAAAQFALSEGNMDAAMWYGEILSSGSNQNRVGEMVRRCFQTLYYGGLIVRTAAGNWASWSSTRWPIAMALSHGGRIIIQLPKVTPKINAGALFWNWLWADCKKESRFTATHGISRDFVAQDIGFGRLKRVQEVKGTFVGIRGKAAWGHHFGVEMALGGSGLLNPYSGRRIAPDGKNGHLYLHYVEATADQYGALMLGCETSSPADRIFSYNSPGFWKSSSDTYGGGHGAGGANNFSATGGLKFTGDMKIKVDGVKKKQKITFQWQEQIGEQLGSMIVDLVGTGVEVVMTKRFDPDSLTEAGPAPSLPSESDKALGKARALLGT